MLTLNTLLTTENTGANLQAFRDNANNAWFFDLDLNQELIAILKAADSYELPSADTTRALDLNFTPKFSEALEKTESCDITPDAAVCLALPLFQDLQREELSHVHRCLTLLLSKNEISAEIQSLLGLPLMQALAQRSTEVIPSLLNLNPQVATFLGYFVNQTLLARYPELFHDLCEANPLIINTAMRDLLFDSHKLKTLGLGLINPRLLLDCSPEITAALQDPMLVTKIAHDNFQLLSDPKFKELTDSAFIHYFLNNTYLQAAYTTKRIKLEPTKLSKSKTSWAQKNALWLDFLQGSEAIANPQKRKQEREKTLDTLVGSAMFKDEEAYVSALALLKAPGMIHLIGQSEEHFFSVVNNFACPSKIAVIKQLAADNQRSAITYTALMDALNLVIAANNAKLKEMKRLEKQESLIKERGDLIKALKEYVDDPKKSGSKKLLTICSLIDNLKNGLGYQTGLLWEQNISYFESPPDQFGIGTNDLRRKVYGALNWDPKCNDPNKSFLYAIKILLKLPKKAIIATPPAATVEIAAKASASGMQPFDGIELDRHTVNERTALHNLR